jgi:hypothetical protein
MPLPSNPTQHSFTVSVLQASVSLAITCMHRMAWMGMMAEGRDGYGQEEGHDHHEMRNRMKAAEDILHRLFNTFIPPPPPYPSPHPLPSFPRPSTTFYP